MLERPMDAKKCNRCKVVQPLSAFNRDRAQADGHQCRCRPCQIATTREWRHRNPEMNRAAARRHRARHVRLSKRDPERERARHKVAKAIARGVLIRPTKCPACGRSDSRIQGHHADYAQPLVVEWLCTWCHAALHTKAKADE